MIGATIFSGIGAPETAVPVVRWILERVQAVDEALSRA